MFEAKLSAIRGKKQYSLVVYLYLRRVCKLGCDCRRGPRF